MLVDIDGRESLLGVSVILTPDRIDLYGNAMLPIVHNFERQLIRLISRYLADFYNADYHLYSFDEVNNRNRLMAEIEAIKSKTLTTLHDALEDAISAAILESVTQEGQVYQEEWEAIPAYAIANARQTISSAMNNIGLDNQPIQTALDTTMAELHLQREAGRPLHEALEPPLRKLVQDGAKALTSEDDARIRALEAIVRATTIKNAKGATILISDLVADRMGFDLYQYSWHPGARPLHQRWQGRIFSRFPGHPRYEWYETGVNMPDGGLMAPNCRHSRMALPSGSEPLFRSYSSPAPRELWPKLDAPKRFEGKRLYPHEAEATMRRFEAETRRNHREKVGAIESGNMARVDALDIMIERRLRRYEEISRVFSIPTQPARLFRLD